MCYADIDEGHTPSLVPSARDRKGSDLDIDEDGALVAMAGTHMKFDIEAVASLRETGFARRRHLQLVAIGPAAAVS